MSIYSQEKSFYVYQYLREDNTPYYIGKGIGKRAFSLCHEISIPKDKSKIQFVSTNMNEADAFQLEMLLIRVHGRIDLGTGCLRNITDGGEGSSGYKHLCDTKVRMAKLRTGKHHSEFTKEKIRNALIGKQNALGSIRSETFKNHLSQIKTGVPRSEETKRKVSVGNTGKKRTDDFKQFRRKPRPTVCCPHCSMIGSDNNMKRYHFDNCKLRICA